MSPRLWRDPKSGTKPGFRWAPLVEIAPPFDPATEISEGPVRTIHPDRVEDARTARALTPAERAARLDAEREERLAAADLTLRLAHDHENRLRALEGHPPLPAAAFRALVKERL